MYSTSFLTKIKIRCFCNKLLKFVNKENDIFGNYTISFRFIFYTVNIIIIFYELEMSKMIKI